MNLGPRKRVPAAPERRAFAEDICFCMESEGKAL